MFDGSANILDEDKVRRHILDCLGALVNKETSCHSTPKPKASIFYRAVIAICEARLRMIDETDEIENGVMLLFQGNFPPSNSKSKMQLEAYNGDWMPTLWIGMIGGIGKNVVCEMLRTELELKPPKKNGDKLYATALHYAAASYKPNFDAIDAISSPHSMRTRDGNGKVPLHWAMQYSHSLSMIQYLIRSNPSAIRMADCDGRFPVEYLFKRKPFTEKLNMIRLLGEADVDESIFKGSSRFGYNVLSMFFGSAAKEGFLEIGELLIARHPKVVFHISESFFQRLPLHWLCTSSCSDAFVLAEKLIAAHPESVAVKDGLGELPVQIAAENGSLKLLKLLLKEHPESFVNLYSLLIHAVSNNNPRDAAEITRYIADLDPTLISKKDHQQLDRLPIHIACFAGSLGAMEVLYECYPQGIYEVDVEGNLPIHRLLVSEGGWDASRDEMLRLLLRHYSGSALVENRQMIENEDFDGEDENEQDVPAEVELRRIPYMIAVDREMSDYVRRLILRAAPACDPQELHRINYAERRMAMFLTYSAITSDPSSTTMVHILRRLMAGHGTDMPLLKHVISFL